MDVHYSGIDGFLGTRASLMLDVVVVAMVGVLLLLAFSVFLVRYRAKYAWHKRAQLLLVSALAIVVALFEADMRIHGWRSRAQSSPYYDSLVMPALSVHLIFSVSTCLLWGWVTVRALREFDSPPQPGPHSPSHRLWGWLAATDMLCTALSGWTFYWLAFAAT